MLKPTASSTDDNIHTHKQLQACPQQFLEEGVGGDVFHLIAALKTGGKSPKEANNRDLAPSVDQVALHRRGRAKCSAETDPKRELQLHLMDPGRVAF